MAIYHLESQVISRNQGRSAVACAAYRSAERLLDERLDRSFDYVRKQQVEHTEILLPKEAPHHFQDREKLWNAVEAHEKRKDAQLAREIVVSLPRELTIEQSILLTREFVQKEFVDRGMIADIAIHTEKTKEGEAQPHAHIMLTMREINQNGFGQKVRAWNEKSYLLSWREAWAETTNRHLALNGHDLRIDHRSLIDQGIELQPQKKIGASAAKDKMAALDDHIKIAFENGEKILKNPNIALDALTRQQSTFTHQDVARLVHRQTVDLEQFNLVYQKVMSSSELVILGKDELNRERLTTKSMLAIEQQMMDDVTALYQTQGHSIKTHLIDTVAQKNTLTEQQKEVLSYITSQGDLKIMTGYAGTGKSHLLNAAREVWEASGYQVRGLTLSGIAAESLEASSGIESRTFASWSYYWDKGERLLSQLDILVVDEAGMLGSREYARVVREAQKSGAKLIGSGDIQQFQAIGAGAPLRATLERTSFIELTEIRRQREAWQREATIDFARGDVIKALDHYSEQNHVHECQTQLAAKQTMVAKWNDVRTSTPEKTQIMLSYTRKDVHELNLMARELRQQSKELGPVHVIATDRGQREMAAGDRIYFLKNDSALQVKNGTLGTIEDISQDGQRLRVRLDKEDQGQHRAVVVDTQKYNHLDYGYAATLYKAQAITVDRSYVLASRYMDAHGSYVGMTRQRERADLFWSKEEFPQQKDLVATLSRDRSKDISLDYVDQKTQQQNFARSYGVALEYHSDIQIMKAIPGKEPAIEKTQATSERALMQAKIKSFMQEARHKQPLEKSEVRQDRLKMPDFKDFAAQYEKKNPERAAAFKQQLMPENEKQALDAMEKFKTLEQKTLASKGRMSNQFDKENMTRYAYELNRQPELMAYIEQHNAALAKQVQTLSKEQERCRDRGGRHL